MTNFTAFPALLASAQSALATLDSSIQQLTTLRDAATAEIAKYLRLESGVELDLDAIQATLTRPYTLLPINEQEAWLIHWRGVKMPIFGWVVAQEPAFIKARVSRSMDLLTPLPAWMKAELGWKPPEHKAVIDGTRTAIRITEGDEASFRKRYGAHLGQRQADGTFKIKGGDAWIKLVASLVRDGILPYTPQPVAPEHWNAKAKSPIELKPYQPPAVKEFLEKGAVLINFPPSAGKTFIALYILSHFVGRVLILADTTVLIEQWKERVAKYVPEANVTISTYQGAGKYLNEEWDLIIPDEAQRLPANTFSKLAFVKTKYRLGLTGTPWREDDRQYLITALCGFPVAVRWSDLIRMGVIRRPRIIVATVPTEAAKTAYVKALVAKRKGRAIIFCDWLEQGEALADSLDVPFIHGATPRKLEKIQEAEVCVISRIGDRGLSLPDLSLVIEVAGQGAAREQFAQRVGRLFHGHDSNFKGEFHTVFTLAEAEKFRARIFGVEAELAGEVDIEFVSIGTGSADKPASLPRPTTFASRKRPASAPKQSPSLAPKARGRDGVGAEPNDEITAIMRLPMVSNKIAKAKESLTHTPGWAEKAFRLCFNATFTPQDIADGMGRSAPRTVRYIRSACRTLKANGLMLEPQPDHFTVDRAALSRLRALASAVGK